MDGANQTKHSILREWLREKIDSGEIRAGSKLPSENQLAGEFHISRQTVRQAIGTLEAEGMVRRIRGSGTYVCSRAFNKTRTYTIGVITTYLNEYVFPDIIKGIEHVLTGQGYSIALGLTYNQVETEARVLQDMINKNVDGLIVEGTKSALPNPNVGLYRQLVVGRIPCVFINGYYPALEFPYIGMNDVKCGELAAKTLIDSGHRNIGGLFKSDDMQGHRRYEGFLRTMRKHQFGVEERHVMWYVTEDTDLLFGGDGDAMVLKRLGDCTGILCYNDQIAIRLIELLARNGKRVPEDISVISFDDSSLCTISSPMLTSVRFRGAEIGETAAQHVLRLMKNYRQDLSIQLDPEIVIRHSVREIHIL